MARNDQSPVPLGEFVDGKYRLERVIGSGGMGVVVQATHVHLEHPMAVKFMRPEAARNSELVARFLREARAACRLKGEHVARVSDVGIVDDIPYFVMEYLEGEDLGTLARRRHPLPPLEVAELVRQACDAVEEAHALGIVHRDLKPANLFLTYKATGASCVKVLDFGISKIEDGSTDKSNTSTGAMLGSPHYMSPEQVRSARHADPRADIWSLGAVLYRLLSGRVPFDAESVGEICAMILRDDVVPLSMVRPDVPPALQAVVTRCLQKAPALRFQSVAELSAALEQATAAHAPAPALPAPALPAGSVPDARALPTPIPPSLPTPIPPPTSPTAARARQDTPTRALRSPTLPTQPPTPPVSHDSLPSSVVQAAPTSGPIVGVAPPPTPAMPSPLPVSMDFAPGSRTPWPTGSGASLGVTGAGLDPGARRWLVPVAVGGTVLALLASAAVLLSGTSSSSSGVAASSAAPVEVASASEVAPGPATAPSSDAAEPHEAPLATASAAGTGVPSGAVQPSAANSAAPAKSKSKPRDFGGRR